MFKQDGLQSVLVNRWVFQGFSFQTRQDTIIRTDEPVYLWSSFQDSTAFSSFVSPFATSLKCVSGMKLRKSINLFTTLIKYSILLLQRSEHKYVVSHAVQLVLQLFFGSSIVWKSASTSCWAQCIQSQCFCKMTAHFLSSSADWERFFLFWSRSSRRPDRTLSHRGIN